MSTIENTVAEALQTSGYGAYTQYAEAPIRALVQREQDITGTILNAAREADVDVDTVERMLTDLGMALPDPEPETVTPFDGDPAAPASVTEAIANITKTLDAIMQAARDNGITIRV